MGSTWMIVNEASGSYDADVIAGLAEAFAASGKPVTRTVRCPDDDLPDAARLDAAGVDLLAIYAGDGTTNSALKAASGWGGAVLILPGGTMNLLARALHGDKPCDEIIASACLEGRTKRLRTVTIAGHCAYVGVIAGPTTSWAKVREGARHHELADMVFNAIPTAIADSLGGPEVGLASGERTFPAIFAAPRDNALALCGFTTSGVGEVLAHARAWLGGDFRDGPHVDLGFARDAVLVSEAETIGLLIDGEPAECRSGERLSLGEASHNFIHTRAGTPA